MPDKLISLDNLETFKDKIEDEIDSKVATKQDTLPSSTNNFGKYLHLNSITGALEWVTIEIPSGALKYIGVTTSSLSDGSTTNPITISSESVTVTNGDTVKYGNKEFVWNGSTWDELGDESKATASALGRVKLGHNDVQSVSANSPSSTSSRTYPIQFDSSDKLVVNVPWTDHTYSNQAASNGGTAESLVTTGDKYNWNNKQDALPTKTGHNGDYLHLNETTNNMEWKTLPDMSQFVKAPELANIISATLTNDQYNMLLNNDVVKYDGQYYIKKFEDDTKISFTAHFVYGLDVSLEESIYLGFTVYKTNKHFEYEESYLDLFSTIQISVSQVKSQSPLTIELTLEQMNKIYSASYHGSTIIIDGSLLGLGSVTCHLMYIGNELVGITDANPDTGDYFKLSFEEQEVVLDSSTITDLTGTKWVLNSSPTLPEYGVYAINFVSNGNNYTQITLTNDAPLIDIHYNSTGAYGGLTPSWTNQAYRIISITGGTAATNSTLISWLQANATLVPVTDLTDTEWEFNDTLDTTTSYFQKKINYESNNTSYNHIYRDYGSNYNFLEFTYAEEMPIDDVYAYYNGAWTNNRAYKTISITGGTDTTNPDLIAWLSQNAAYQNPNPEYKYILTAELNNFIVNKVTASEIDSEEATSGQVLMADGEGGASWGSVSSGTEVEANVTIPVGTTPSDLLNLKVGSDYFNIDKPIHFIKLTSSTLTEALRSEILSDEYFVILEYNNSYYYEKEKNTYNEKVFETLIGVNYSGTNGYNGTVDMVYYSITVSPSALGIILSTTTRGAIRSASNVSKNNINSKTDASTNATAGKVLTADGSGGTSWGNVSQLGYLTTAPTQDNTEGGIKIVVLSSDSGITKYNGYLYLITGA